MERRVRARGGLDAAMAAAVVMVAAVVVAQAAVAGATTYTVGAPEGLWDMETDYNEWVNRRTFHPGDKITFTYSRELHDVVEVTKAGYDACSNANNISAFRSGNDVITLAAVGTRYFLCGLTGHCDSGMKIRIDVIAAASGPSAAAGPTAAPPPSTTSASSPPVTAGIGLVHVIFSSIDSTAIMAAKALLILAMASAVLTTALGATTYTVGAPNGSWDMRTNYAQWVSNINFRVEDQIVFKYSSSVHDVVEVTKANYDSCSASGAIATFTSGDDTVQLNAVGTRYFICGVPGHCTAGMKVAVKVEAATGSNTAPSPRTPAAMAPNAIPPTVGGRPVPPSSSASKSVGVRSLVGLSLSAIAAGLMINLHITPTAIMAAKVLLLVAMASAVLATALGATTYTVGAPNGSWDTRTNYAQWVSSINFRVGDQIVFKYSSSAHDVVEVNKAGYDACSASGPIATFTSGDDTVQLSAAGTRYFICGVPGHCTAGMKVAIEVKAATGSNSAPSPMAPRAGTPAAMAPNAMAPKAGGRPVPPSSSASKSVGVESLVGLGLGVLVAGLMVFY
uniref:Phytocyanin domain-containing protein n=1 Tax=Leersia perrieri TaxID=77586 RepID=A0A0D9X467_9ORYZ